MKLKHYLLSFLVFLKSGTFSPESMKTPVSKKRIYMNCSDERAYKKIAIDFARNRESTPMRFFREHVAHLGEPLLCLDIGANYGECFANADYKIAAVIAIEANPLLWPFLKKTRSVHPDKEKIHIRNVLVADKYVEHVDFHYSEIWSGGGSAAVKGNNPKKMSLSSRPLEEVIQSTGCEDFDSLLFKIDVEGFEGRVLGPYLQKMSNRRVAGIIEFETEMLQAAGTDPQTFYRSLAERFLVFHTKRRSTELTHLKEWADLAALFNKKEFHCDLAVFTDEHMIADGWHIKQIPVNA
jgi:FkbM family methyltransferase